MNPGAFKNSVGLRNSLFVVLIALLALSAFPPVPAIAAPDSVSSLVPTLLFAPLDPQDDSGTTNEDMPVTLNVLTNDGGDPNSLYIKTVSLPLHGSIIINKDNSLTYTPYPDYYGPDSFTYTVSDDLNTGTATVTIDVLPVNDPPAAQDDSASTPQGAPVVIPVLDNDTDIEGDSLSIDSVVASPNGSAVVDGLTQTITYTPAPTFIGTDVFTYTVHDGNTGYASAQVYVTVTPRADLAIDKSASHDPVNAGGALTYTITAANLGPTAFSGQTTAQDSSADPILIPSSGASTPYPSSIEFSGLLGTISDVQVTLNGLEHTFPDDLDLLLVGPQGQHTLLMSDAGGGPNISGVDLIFSDSAISPLPNTEIITSGTYLPTDYTDTSTDSFSAPAPAGPYTASLAAFHGTDPNGFWSLYIMDDAGGDSGALSAGWSLSLTLEAPPVTITDTLPAGTTFQSASAPTGWSCNETAGVVTCSTLELPVGSPAELQIHVTAPAETGTVANTAEISSPLPDPDPSNNTASVSTQVVPGADLSITKSVDPTSASPGQSVAFTLAYANDGPHTATNVTITDILPVEFTDVSFSSSPALADPSGGPTYSWSLPDLAPGDSGTITITAKTASDLAADTLLTNTASIDSPQENDPSDNQDTATVTILNDSPQAVDDTASTDEDVAVEIDVLANDSDANGDPLTVSAVSIPANGTAVIFTEPLSGDTWVRYTPNPNYYGTDSFTYDVTDGSSTATATVQVTVNAVNDAPILAFIDNKSVDEGSTLPFTASATDVDAASGELVFSLGSAAPAGAAIDPTSGEFSWTPDESQGYDVYSITVIVTDQGDPAESDSQTFSVTVNEVDNAPVLEPIGDQSVDEQATLTFTASASDSDPEPNPLTYSLEGSPPAGAAIDPSTGVFTWTPTEDQGPNTYTFTIRVTDGTPLSDEETITVTVNEVNQAPQIFPIPDQFIDEGMTLFFSVFAFDPDDPPNTITYSLGTGAPMGAFIDPLFGIFTWTPGEDQGPGTYTFDILATDNGTPSQTGSQSVTITVNEVNQPPVMDPIDDVIMDETTELRFTPTVIDPDLPANTLTFSLGLGAPPGAEINSGTGEFTWMPKESQGPNVYTITIIVTDGSLDDSQTFTITVNEINNAPVLGQIGNKNVDEGGTVSFTANATDNDPGTTILTYSLDPGAPAGASIDPTSGLFTWATTEADGPGSYPITIRVTDDGSPILDDYETITVTVNEVNNFPPTANDDTFSVNQNSNAVPLDVLLNDTFSPDDAETLTIKSVTDPANGTVTFTTEYVTYQPDFGFTGEDTFTYTMWDGLYESTATVTINVVDVPDAPVANDDPHYTTDEDIPLVVNAFLGVLWNDGDPDAGDTLTVTESTQPSNGTVLMNADGSFTYTPQANFNGTDQFTYTVSDDGGLKDTALVTITVNALPDPPTVMDDTATTLEETPVTLYPLENDDDPDGDDLSITDLGTPAYGSAVLVGDSVVYTPEIDFFGTDSFSYTVSDGTHTVTGTITITVNNSQDTPIAVDDAVSTAEDTPLEIDVLVNDSDPDKETLTISSVGDPANGSAVIAGNRILYTPDPDFNGADSFSYTVTDGEFSATATVNVTVTPVNDPPQAVDDQSTTPQDTPVSISVLDNDTDVDTGDTLQLLSVTQPANGSAVVSGIQVVYTPDPGFTGVDTFTYTVSDGEKSDQATVTVTVEQTQKFVFLPLVVATSYTPPTPKPDLVGTFQLTPNKASFSAGEPVSITVTVTNQGEAPASGFWVDFYINPSTPPTAPNMLWNDLCGMEPCFGIAWFVTEELSPGESVTLTSTPDSYSPQHSDWLGWFASGTSDLYLFVDAWNKGNSNGAVYESNEINNRAELHGLQVTGTNPSYSEPLQKEVNSSGNLTDGILPSKTDTFIDER